MTVYLSWHSGTKDSGSEKEVPSELPEFLEEAVNDSQEDISEKDTPEKDMQIGIVGKEKVQDMSVTFEETGEASLKEVDMISMTGLAGRRLLGNSVGGDGNGSYRFLLLCRWFFSGICQCDWCRFYCRLPDLAPCEGNL